VPPPSITVELFLFDTGAQRLYKERAGRYWDAVSLGIICYDCSSRASFEAVPRWCQALRELRKSAQVPVALVATKGDMQGAGCVPSEEGAELARSLGLQFFETSAAPPGRGVDAPFEFVAKTFADTYESAVARATQAGS
jgi:GTPase SAR1 family protein